MSSTFCVSYILPTQSRDFGAFPNPAKNVQDHFFSTLLMNEIKTAFSLQNRRANSHSTQEKLSKWYPSCKYRLPNRILTILKKLLRKMVSILVMDQPNIQELIFLKGLNAGAWDFVKVPALIKLVLQHILFSEFFFLKLVSDLWCTWDGMALFAENTFCRKDNMLKI